MTPRDPTRRATTYSGYVLGHSEAVLRRLTFQAALIEPITRELLADAGIAEGMRVLDVGTGRGDVAFLVAEIVGDTDITCRVWPTLVSAA